MGASVPGGAPTSGGALDALLDVFKVLYDPGAVFERVRQKPTFLMPFIGIVIVQLIIGIINLPFMKIALTAQMAARSAQAPAGGPNPADFAWVGLIFVPIAFAVIFLLSAFILWVLVSLVGGDGKYRTLLSVTTHASVPSVIVLTIVSAIVLQMQGPGDLTGPQDMQAALGLDLVVSAKGFVGAIAKGINPFSIWSLVLTAIGVSTTHGLSKGSGYTVATLSFVFGLLIAGAFGALGGG